MTTASPAGYTRAARRPPRAADVTVGDRLEPVSISLTRADLVRYAGASGDFNVIHWNDRVAQAVGLPGVIAHGMLTMGQAVRVVTEWTGDPTRVESYSVRFTRPIAIPDDDHGTTVEFNGTVRDVDGDRITVDIDARANGQTVLAKARAVVRLS